MPAGTWLSVACVALGGALGSVLRFAVSQWSAQRFGDSFPWGTLSVNLLGSFAFGALWGLGPTVSASPLLRALLLSGVLGGFTTFSSFMFDSARLFEAERPGYAFTNLIVQNVFGLLLFWLGLGIGRSLSR
jgi:fluoride exporter